MYTLVVCEKPDAARRIAHALGSPAETRNQGVSVFDLEWNGSRYVITSAVGHLYGVSDATSTRSVYPVLDLEWAPVAKNPRALRAIRVISALARDARSFIHACDYDQEGEVIGHSILQYACNGAYRNARRAKFSTLTDDEIRESFSNLSPPSERLAEAGRSRHVLDFLYGINLSRALSKSFRVARGGYQNLSIGRVQGPTLAFAADREFDIRLHVPDPYWTLSAVLAKDGKEFSAEYARQRIERQAEAEGIYRSCVGMSGTVKSVSSRRMSLSPPTPFNIGDLQREAYRLFKVSPGYTLAIAEKLYLGALISYPRTSSQKLPRSIGYSKILSGISQIGAYSKDAAFLLSRSALSPHEGRMSDPAHPAIYPTGVAPRARLGGLEFKIFDLIVRRFLATFGDPGAVLRTDVAIDIAGHDFTAEGAGVIHEGWMALYRPYVSVDRHFIPALQQGDIVDNLRVDMNGRFTQPPRRYSQAGLLAKMEQEEIGTKATRADIISTLFKRNYVSSSRDGIVVSDLGLAVVESMKEHVPAIVSTGLTREIEQELEKIELGTGDIVSAIEPAVDRLVESLSALMESEASIGTKIADASTFDRAESLAVGACPLCKKGQLRIITSRKSKKRFVGCSNYAQAGCTATAPLPQRGSIRATGKACAECGWPVVGVLFARRSKQWRICVNMACPSKKKSGSA